MEENNPNQPTSSFGTPLQPNERSVGNQRGNLRVILGIMVLLLVAGGAYYLGAQRNNIATITNQNATSAKIQALPTPSPTEISSPQTRSISSDWTLKSSTYCAVKFPIPPDKEPYVEFIGQDTLSPRDKRSWQLREGNRAADGHKIFTNDSSLVYVADIEASGYIAGLVGVQCAPKASYSLTNVAESYAAGFASDAGIKVKSKRTTKIWGMDVVAAQFEGGMFGGNEIYFVIVGNNVYKIDKKSDSNKEFVRSTTEQIFNNLQFF